MFLSVFDIFKIGIGPSSSHTVGPMVAASRFLEDLLEFDRVQRVTVHLHGSLAFTGKGHGTDRAICLGLCGQTPECLDPNKVDDIVEALKSGRRLVAVGAIGVRFDLDRDLVFDRDMPLEAHPNGMTFRGHDSAGEIVVERVYYSIGGGFVVTSQELSELGDKPLSTTDSTPVPHPFSSAGDMLDMGKECGLSIAEMKRANERARSQDFASDVELDAAIDTIWNAMNACMDRGLGARGRLPGGLDVSRRAAAIYEKIIAEEGLNAQQPHRAMDWLSVYAMAVNEENAAGGRVVTAPTNGAAGVVPAVIRYYRDHCLNPQPERIRDFLLTAAAIGGLIKANASISGAEVGCQGEVGSASAMAAAGLAAALGGNNRQVENAAEIALEHHLGMTCDPIGGLVQVPCIERNALGAVKAVTAASLAMRGDGSHFVGLDQCIETMRQTGLDMSSKYKETSTGGLAVNVVEC